MRTLLVVGLLLLVPFAAAQQSASLLLQVAMPDRALTREGPLEIAGVATYTADATAYTSLVGIPVYYEVTAAPEWALVTISPPEDVFPLPMNPHPTFTVTRGLLVTVLAGEEASGDLRGVIEIRATTGAGLAGRSTTATLAFPIVFLGEEKPCHDASETASAVEASDALLQSPPSEGGEVTVQQSGASPLPTPWLVVAAFGLVGAGVAIVVRARKLR